MKRPSMQWGMSKRSNQEIRQRNSKNTGPSSPASASAAVGLRILTQIPETTRSRIVVKSQVTASLRAVKPASQARPQNSSNLQYSCFLKACSLCHKKLSPDQDIYMYRGDEGYCTVKCRDRRIVMDEMKELEAPTKRMVSSPRHCNAASPRSETRLLREELWRRRQQHHLIAPKARTVVL